MIIRIVFITIVYILFCNHTMYLVRRFVAHYEEVTARERVWVAIYQYDSVECPASCPWHDTLVAAGLWQHHWVVLPHHDPVYPHTHNYSSSPCNYEVSKYTDNTTDKLFIHLKSVLRRKGCHQLSKSDFTAQKQGILSYLPVTLLALFEWSVGFWNSEVYAK